MESATRSCPSTGAADGWCRSSDGAATTSPTRSSTVDTKCLRLFGSRPWPGWGHRAADAARDERPPTSRYSTRPRAVASEDVDGAGHDERGQGEGDRGLGDHHHLG